MEWHKPTAQLKSKYPYIKIDISANDMICVSYLNGRPIKIINPHLNNKWQYELDKINRVAGEKLKQFQADNNLSIVT